MRATRHLAAWSLGWALALAACGGGVETPDNDAAASADAYVPPSGGNCIVDGARCLCDADPREDDVPFGRRCDLSAFGAVPTVCCQRASSCYCEPVRCGITDDGACLCGVGIFGLRTIVDSCQGMASTCCTYDTGYCICEDGCEEQFESREVLFCDTTTDTAVCPSDSTPVPSCE